MGKVDIWPYGERSGAIFIVPNDLKMGSDTQWLMEKGVLTKQELLGMVELIDQEMKRKREVGM
jgi:hypothetical protein